jgi:RNA-dependent RNA polymerase
LFPDPVCSLPSGYYVVLTRIARFLGYKGMVGIDERLEGKRMKLRSVPAPTYTFHRKIARFRPSMNKFMVHDQAEAEIEIARAFDRPMTCMLSR